MEIRVIGAELALYEGGGEGKQWLHSWYRREMTRTAGYGPGLEDRPELVITVLTSEG